MNVILNCYAKCESMAYLESMVNVIGPTVFISIKKSLLYNNTNNKNFVGVRQIFFSSQA